MKVHNSANYPFSIRPQTENPLASADDSASFAGILAENTSGVSNATTGVSGTRQINFTDMGRQQMRDWVNEEIKNGKMTLDESSPFMLMTMKVPVTGSFGDVAAGDTPHQNFKKQALLGIEGAWSRDDLDTARRLQVAVDLMLNHESRIYG